MRNGVNVSFLARPCRNPFSLGLVILHVEIEKGRCEVSEAPQTTAMFGSCLLGPECRDEVVRWLNAEKYNGPGALGLGLVSDGKSTDG